MEIEADFHAAIRKERREAKAAGQAFAAACRSGDVEALFEAVDRLNGWTCGGWPHAFRAVLRTVEKAPTLDLRRAFLRAWMEHKSIASHFDQHRLLIDGLRKLLPPYKGGGRRLYRGAFWRERCRRTYGISWTADAVIAADKFATDTRQHSAGGSCVLEADVSAEAIIGTMETVGDYYQEREYLVDRRRLGRVRVIQRFPQLPMPEHTTRWLG